MDLTYTIREFDNINKVVIVDFEDGGWASIGLINPLPKDKTELEDIIRKFAKPQEAIEAQTNPDSNLEYVSSLVGVSQTCARLSVSNSNPNKQTPIDPEVEANLKMWEEVQFEQKVGNALVKLGVLTTNPTTIPTSNV
jgi:hypothetical protein